MTRQAQSNLQTRPAQDRDFQSIAELWTAAYITSGLVQRKDAFTRDDVIRAAACGELQLAETAGQILGVVVLVRHGTPLASLTTRNDEMQVCLLAVSPSAQRLGIARQLMAWCHARATQHGSRVLWLWTRPTQTAAHRLYESLDYQRRPELDSAPEGQPRLAYRLALF